MDLLGILLIGAVAIFGSIYAACTAWTACKELRVSDRGAEANRVVSWSTWIQHGSTILATLVFLGVAISLTFSMTQKESFAQAMMQWNSLKQASQDNRLMWGEDGNQGTLHTSSTPRGDRVTGASLTYIQFDNSDLKRLTEQYPHLAWIILSGTQVDDEALDILARSECLEALVLTDTSITDRGLAALRGNQRLRELDLARTAVTDRSMDVISSLTNLQHLGLNETNVTDRGLQALAGNTSLRTLDIQGTDVSDDAVATLATIPNLGVLLADKDSLSVDAITRLKRAVPRCELAFEFR